MGALKHKYNVLIVNILKAVSYLPTCPKTNATRYNPNTKVGLALIYN